MPQTNPEQPIGPTGGGLWLGLGLLLATMATLLLEVLDARLLSVLTWYHLSFFAVSLAMLGMAAGAVFVFLDANRFGFGSAPRALARTATWLACAIPLSHIVNLVVPFLPLDSFSTMEILSIVVSTVALAVPFVLSGIVVTVALTRCGGSIGRLYALDLLGAAAGCLLVVPILDRTNISSAIFMSGMLAALSAACFHRFAGTRGTWPAVALSAVLGAIVIANSGTAAPLHLVYPKNRNAWLGRHAETHWNSHSYVAADSPGDGPVFLWGPGIGSEAFRTASAWLVIDGEAGTPISRWDGNVESLNWVSYDVTSLVYQIRRGEVAVIGVGGGRDLLSALWGRSRSITGIDVNEIMLDLLRGRFRDFARIADRPEVTLVHDDGRAYLTRTSQRFDVIQMSLVDTWAATGAGAFTLSENGLYTLDAWRIFLDRLKPGGILSVSRWFDPTNVSETNRLVALGMAAVLDRSGTSPAGPSAHVILATRQRVATIMVSTTPFSAADVATIRELAATRGFDLVVTPGHVSETGGPQLARIAGSATVDALAEATAHPSFDYTPPTDRRPYYFNMLKPAFFLRERDAERGGIVGGNLRATATLLVLLLVSVALVALIIGWPLIRAGRPPMPTRRFLATMSYFGIIGFAYMLVQIGLLQRFAIFMGHPTYTLAIILFSMLLFTGIGSWISERLDVGGRGLYRVVPACIAVALTIILLGLPAVIARAVTAEIWARTAIVMLFTAPLSMLLGMCFPIGVRLVRDTPAVVAWTWGVNGAFGVLASIIAVAISIWIGIDTNFAIAGALYLGLTWPLTVMARRS